MMYFVLPSGITCEGNASDPMPDLKEVKEPSKEKKPSESKTTKGN